MATKYQKNPIVNEVVRWDGLNLQEVKDFVGDNLKYEIYDSAWQVGKGAPQVDMEIKTLEGDMKVTKGDYIIKGIKGEFYPCKPDIFDATYSKYEDEKTLYSVWSNESGMVVITDELYRAKKVYSEEVNMVNDGESYEEDHVVMGIVLRQWSAFQEWEKERKCHAIQESERKKEGLDKQ